MFTALLIFGEPFTRIHEYCGCVVTPYLTKIEQAQTRNVAEEYNRFVANTAAPQAMTTEEIEDASAADEELEYVQQSVETGNWENSNCANYKPIRDELCLFGKIVL